MIHTPEFGPEKVKDSLQCVHCGCHWFVPAGQGNTRGYCQKCAGPTCEGPWCRGMGGCPGAFEQQIEAYERRMAHLALRGY